jgi:hypothetical protein
MALLVVTGHITVTVSFAEEKLRGIQGASRDGLIQFGCVQASPPASINQGAIITAAHGYSLPQSLFSDFFSSGLFPSFGLFFNPLFI